jgi:predicted NodU family carbamoyl transferase
MIILGVTDSFTSGAAISIDGRTVAAVNEERLDRNKMSMGFPNLSIAEVMRIAGIEAKDIDHVAVATSDLFWRPDAVPYSDYFRDSKGGLRDSFLSLGSTFSKIAGDSQVARELYFGMKRQLTRARKRELPLRLKQNFGITAPISFLDHHGKHLTSTRNQKRPATVTAATRLVKAVCSLGVSSKREPEWSK